MITEDLVAYIQSQTKKNIPKDTIVAHLAGAGWRSEDIAEGFAKLAPVVPASLRAVPFVTPPIQKIPVVSSVPVQEPKVWVPMSVKPPIQVQPSASVAPVAQPIPTQAKPTEIKVAPTVAEIKPIAPEIKIPPLQAPVVVSAENKPKQFVDSIRIPAKETPVVTQTPSMPKPAPVPGTLPEGLAIALGQSAPQPIPVAAPLIKPAPSIVTQAPVTPSAPAVVPPMVVPPVKQATPVQPAFVSPQKETLESSISSILGQQKPMTRDSQHASVDANLSKRAMIYSYKQDSMLSASQPTAKKVHKVTIKITKPVGIAIAAIFLVGAFSFIFAKGYIQLPRFALSIVKKDPQTVLLEATSKFKHVKSYKSQVSMRLTLPSFATITTGLVSGNSVQGNDVDTVSITAHGQVTNSTLLTPALYDYATTIKSSLLLDDIISEWKYDGSTSYATIPSLSELFGANAPPEATVAIPNGQLGQLLPELSPNIQEVIKKADVYDIVGKGVPPYAQEQMAKAFQTFIGTVTVMEKPEETIHGIASYHYSLEASHDATKKFLTDVFDVFSIPLSDGMKQDINEGLGAATLDSFDVWVNKDTNVLDQYQLTLTAPLSKVIALDDKGIAGKEVTLSFEDTLYDVDVPNKIAMPISAISIDDFVKSIRDAKIKNIISSFPPNAKSLVNAEGGYGKKANVGGSCLDPVPGSLFSPTGHNPGASSQIGFIASTMDTLLNETDNTGSCYSTPNAWALAVPLSGDTPSYYCADSSGALVTTTAPLSGTVCK